MPAIDPPLLSLLGLVALALFFENYDQSMLTSALKHIAQDLGVEERELGTLTMWVRLGAVPAFLLIPFADRIGRRRVFLVSVIGISLGTCATAASQSLLQFVLLQMVTRTFLVTGMAVAFVIVTEEMPAEHRGWGIGMLGALGACGVGMGAIVFAGIDHLPGGWRSLYAIGIAPLLLLPAFRRGVRETARFRRHAASRGTVPGVGGWLQPLVGLVRLYPGRALGITAVALLMALGQGVVFQFTGYFVQTVHGWQPWHYSTLVVTGGLLGILGNVVAGSLGDRFGRRRVGFLMMCCFPLFSLLFYQGPEALVAPAWIAFVFCTTAETTIVRAVAAELFPTSQRGTATGWLALVETVGAALGLGLVSLGTREPGTLTGVASALGFAVMGAGLLLLALPETSRRELEAISHEATG